MNVDRILSMSCVSKRRIERRLLPLLLDCKWKQQERYQYGCILL